MHLFLTLFYFICVENLCYIYLFYLNVVKAINFGSPLSNHGSVVVPSLCLSCALVSFSSLWHVSISHQTLCTYISSKLTPCESAELYDHVITAYIIIIWCSHLLNTCYIICYCYFMLFCLFYLFITLQVPFRLESLWVEMIHTRTDFRIGKNRYGMKW